MTVLELSMLLLDGDIESNPGPPVDSVTFKIEKAVLGSFHQGHSKFGSSSGIQCSCNALYAICFSLMKKVSIWKSWDLDYILENGDAVFTVIGIPRALSMNELPQNIMIENHNIEIEMLSEHFGLLGQNELFKDHKFCDTGNGLIFTTGGFSFSLIWSKNSVFLFDSHSRDKNGAFVSNGSSVALSFKSLIGVQNYIKTEYLKQFPNFHHMQYDIQYVRVSKDSLSAISDSIKKYRKKIRNQTYFNKISDTDKHNELKKRKCEKRAELFGTPEHENIKKQKCRKRAELFGTPEHENIKKQKCRKRAELFGTPEHENIKKQKCRKRAELFGTPEHDEIKKERRQRYLEQKKRTARTEKIHKIKSSEERISKFTEAIKEGPYYVCVICNRCLYFRSVILFKYENYGINRIDFYREVVSPDGKIYVCLTCHKKLKKSEIPSQAVCNKLDIFDFPDDLSNLNRLEKAIISRRILFKKVTIMPKAQTPKLKGSICNVPIDTVDVANTLPQGADSNGIVMIKLKRKLLYRGHVYFEAVSPDLVRSALEYLKMNNPLYGDILD